MPGGRDDVAVLWDIRVSPRERGGGIGSALFRAAGDWLKPAAAGGSRSRLRTSTCRPAVSTRRWAARWAPSTGSRIPASQPRCNCCGGRRWNRLTRNPADPISALTTSCCVRFPAGRARREVHRIVLDPETKLMLHEHGELGCSRTRSAAISEEHVGSRTDLSDPRVELASEPRLLGPCSTEPLRPEDHRSLRQRRDSSRPYPHVGDYKSWKAPREGQSTLEVAVLRREVETRLPSLLVRMNS
jgi:Acetyltransferase (GNAT) family